MEVTAFNEVGESNKSPALLATVALPPSVPQSLLIHHLSLHHMQVMWSAPASTNGATISAYNIYLREEGMDEVKVGQTPGSVFSYELSSLTAGALYHIAISASNLSGEGERANATDYSGVLPLAPL